LDELVQGGHDVTSIKYYSVAITTVLFYDYFLTLEDEVRYAWKGRKSWAFAIFFLNRYLPMVYMTWIAVSNHSWAYTYEMCTKTSFIEIIFFVWCTLIAQIILTTRIYAITMKNTIIASLFVCITIPQFALGIYMIVLAASAPAQRLPSIHLTAYQLCVFTRHRSVETAYTAISLLYDFSAFVVIIVLAAKSGIKGFRMPGILRTIVQDATVYFLVIFTSHFVLEMTLLVARPSLQLLPAVGNNVYLPVMIGRLMLSLKKAADNSKVGWSLTDMTRTQSPGAYTWGRSYRVQFAPMSEEDPILPTDGGIPLSNVLSPMP